MEMRIEIVSHYFPDSPIGTSKAEDDSFEIKAKFGLNYRVDKNAFEAMAALLSADELDCVRWKPELDLKKYKSLDDSERQNLDECIIVTPSAPTVEIKEI